MSLVFKSKKELSKWEYQAKNPNRICSVEGCFDLGQNMGTKRADGTLVRRNKCPKHHAEFQANKKGLTSTEWTNSFHPYLKYRKDYCENIDGRLGHKCTTTIVWSGQLDTDHINGDPTSHETLGAAAMQTLCKSCHAYKTWKYGDGQTAGRKTLKERKEAA